RGRAASGGCDGDLRNHSSRSSKCRQAKRRRRYRRYPETNPAERSDCEHEGLSAEGHRGQLQPPLTSSYKERLHVPEQKLSFKRYGDPVPHVCFAVYGVRSTTDSDTHAILVAPRRSARRLQCRLEVLRREPVHRGGDQIPRCHSPISQKSDRG